MPSDDEPRRAGRRIRRHATTPTKVVIALALVLALGATIWINWFGGRGLWDGPRWLLGTLLALLFMVISVVVHGDYGSNKSVGTRAEAL